MTSDGNNFVMPVAPYNGGVYGGYGNGGNNGGLFGGDLWGFLLVLLLCGNGMWGGFGGFGGGMMWPMMMGGMGAGMGLDYLYPWLNNSEHISDGFRDQQIQSTLTGIQSGITTGFGNVQNALCQGFGGVQNALCSGFAGTTAAVTGAQNAISQQLYSNELASLNRSFAEQTANTAGFTGVQSGLCDAKYASATNTRDILDNQNRTSQMIMDKLCALELDGVKGQLEQARRDNVGLQNQLNMANLAASQAAQTGNIRDAIIGELRSCPIPAQPVYGSQPIFTCGGTNTGCGCNGAFVN